LTKKRIESNLGPSWNKFEEKLKVKLGNYFNYFKKSIDNLQNAIFEEFQDLPNVDNIKNYLEKKKNNIVKLEITKVFLTQSMKLLIVCLFCLLSS
jgi:hypothetical protein